jgi:hypothetical protein
VAESYLTGVEDCPQGGGGGRRKRSSVKRGRRGIKRRLLRAASNGGHPGGRRRRRTTSSVVRGELGVLIQRIRTWQGGIGWSAQPILGPNFFQAAPKLEYQASISGLKAGVALSREK